MNNWKTRLAIALLSALPTDAIARSTSIGSTRSFLPASPMKHDFRYYVRNNLHITPSGMFDPAQLRYALEAIGADRILYSVDYPYYPNEGARKFLEDAPMSQQDKEKIAYRNAEKLFRLR